VDYLRNPHNQLIGFGYTMGTEDWDLDFYKRLTGLSGQIRSQEGMLMIFFTEQDFKVQCVQAIGSQIYGSLGNDFMLAVPDWDFGELGFQLSSPSGLRLNSYN
jgi:hypothetical protein